MTIAARKLRQKEEMKDLILNTAMKLFLEEGFGNVSIRRIAEKIEYSPATIYLYFKDKDDILCALHCAGFEELYKRQQSIRSIKDPAKRLHKHGEIYIRFALENPEYYNLMFIMRSPIKKFEEGGEQWNIGMRSYDVLRSDVKAVIDAGILHDKDVEIVSFGLWSLVHGMVSLILRNRCSMMDPAELPSFAKETLRFVMNTLYAKA